MVFTKQRRFLK